MKDVLHSRPVPDDTGLAGPWPQGFVVVAPRTPDEYVVPIHDVLVIGRECGGVDPSHRLLIDDQTVSRRHVEIRLDVERDRATLFDVSTNGTRLNGERVERATDVRILPGDILTIGTIILEFRADRFFDASLRPGVGSTLIGLTLAEMAMVAGDLISFSTIAQYTDQDVLLREVDRIYRSLRALIIDHRGVVNHYAGDAFFGVWEADNDPAAYGHAAEFVIAADECVTELAPSLQLRTPDGEPVRMGFGIEFGQAAVSVLPGRHLSYLGDAVNLTFRLSTIAGRDGRANVLATARVEERLRDRFALTDPGDVEVKGRTGTERVYALGRR